MKNCPRCNLPTFIEEKDRCTACRYTSTLDPIEDEAGTSDPNPDDDKVAFFDESGNPVPPTAGQWSEAEKQALTIERDNALAAIALLQADLEAKDIELAEFKKSFHASVSERTADLSEKCGRALTENRKLTAELDEARNEISRLKETQPNLG